MDEGTNFSAAGFFYFCPVNVLFTEAEKSVKKGCALKIQEKDCGTRCMMSIFGTMKVHEEDGNAREIHPITYVMN